MQAFYAVWMTKHKGKNLYMYRVGHKKRGHGLMTIILSNLNRLEKFTEDSLVNLQLNANKIPAHLAYVVTLPSETLTSAIQAIKDKLQGM